jgi:hypothetical protein
MTWIVQFQLTDVTAMWQRLEMDPCGTWSKVEKSVEEFFRLILFAAENNFFEFNQTESGEDGRR